MNRTEYLAAVNEFMYQGEVLGEAVLGRWLQLESDGLSGVISLLQWPIMRPAQN